MHCTSCGSKIEGEGKFCTKCGTPLGGLAAEPHSGKWKVSRLWEGRIGRLRYFYGLLFSFLLMLAPLAVFVAIWGVVRVLYDAASMPEAGALYVITQLVGVTIPILIALSIFVPIFGMHTVLAIRRCHDAGHSGWFYLFTWIPYVGLIFVCYLLFKKGEVTANQYGLPPSENRKFLADIFNY